MLRPPSSSQEYHLFNQLLCWCIMAFISIGTMFLYWKIGPNIDEAVTVVGATSAWKNATIHHQQVFAMTWATKINFATTDMKQWAICPFECWHHPLFMRSEFCIDQMIHIEWMFSTNVTNSKFNVSMSELTYKFLWIPSISPFVHKYFMF